MEVDAAIMKTSTLIRLFKFLRPKTAQYFITMGLTALVLAFERLLAGFVLKWFTDSITTGDLLLMRNTLLFWLVYALIMVITAPFLGYYWRASVIHAVSSLRQVLFSHVQRLPFDYLQTHHSGEAMSLLTNDIAAAERAYQETIFNLVRNTIQGIGALILMLFFKWDLALLIILSSLIPMVINALYAKPLRRVGDMTQSQLALLSERLADLLGGYQVVRIFNLGDWIFERYTHSDQGVLDAGLKRVRLESDLAAANDFSGFIFIIQFFIGTYMVLRGQTTMGVLIGLIQLNFPVQVFFGSIGSTISSIQGSLAAADRIFKVLDTTQEPERYPAVAAAEDLVEVSDAQVEFEAVQFSYGEEQLVLDSLSFAVQPGQLAAFVGPSGGGKSTIFRLLLGFYSVQEGAVTVLDKPVHAYSLRALRDLFAYVPQDSFLYYGTVMENIRFGRPGASDEDVFLAARASYAHDFILGLPHGYMTLVGERGARLSGGQRQRIAIARALLKNAPILLLDEATSSLDSESESLVQKALESLMKGRTTLAIAHRLSTVENADQIYVVERGRVVEHGRHADLLEKDGLYNHLYQMQFEIAQPDEGQPPDVSQAASD